MALHVRGYLRVSQGGPGFPTYILNVTRIACSVLVNWFGFWVNFYSLIKGGCHDFQYLDPKSSWHLDWWEYVFKTSFTGKTSILFILKKFRIEILLHFGVPDNQILLSFGVPDNQILLHFGVPSPHFLLGMLCAAHSCFSCSVNC